MFLLLKICHALDLEVYLKVIYSKPVNIRPSNNISPPKLQKVKEIIDEWMSGKPQLN